MSRLRIAEEVIATLVGCPDALEQLVAQRRIEEGRIGVQLDGCVGFTELIGALVDRVVGEQALDTTQVRAEHAQTTRAESVD